MRWGLQIQGLTRSHYVTCRPQRSVWIFWWLILPRRMEPFGRFLAPRGQTSQSLRWKKNHYGWRTVSFARQPERLSFVMFVAGMVEQLIILITRGRWLIRSIMLRGFGSICQNVFHMKITVKCLLVPNICAATLFKMSWVPNSGQFDEMRRIDAFDLQLNLVQSPQPQSNSKLHQSISWLKGRTVLVLSQNAIELTGNLHMWWKSLLFSLNAMVLVVLLLLFYLRETIVDGISSFK